MHTAHAHDHAHTLLRRLRCAGLLLLALAGAAAARAEPGVTATTVTLGMVNAQSGPASALGLGMAQGVRAVFDAINAQGGVHGRKLALNVADDGYEPENTVEETYLMVADQSVLALLGYVGTPTTSAALPLLREADVPLVGVLSGAMSLRRPVTRQVFNVRASYEDETEALVNELYSAGARRIAVVYQNDGFGLSVLSGTSKALQQRGGKLAATGNFQRNTTALRRALAAMVDAQPDAVVLAGPYTPVAAFIQQARAAGLKSRFATVSFVSTENLQQQLGAAGDGVLVSQVVPHPRESTTPAALACRDMVQRHAGTAMSYASFEGCLTAWLMVDALRQAGPLPTRQKLMAALECARGDDLGGVGMQFTQDQHQANAQVYLTQLQGGQIVSIDHWPPAGGE